MSVSLQVTVDRLLCCIDSFRDWQLYGNEKMARAGYMGPDRIAVDSVGKVVSGPSDWRACEHYPVSIYAVNPAAVLLPCEFSPHDRKSRA
jgi:hypothetical protein